MRRISVVGTSGSGKSRVARELSRILGAPHIELDALHWGAGWSAASADELRERVQREIGGDAWVIDGNYQSKLGTLVWQRADAVVWMNPRRWRVMVRSVRRTIRRVVTREELWNGNRESWRALMFWRGEDSILWWAWTSYSRNERRYEGAMSDPRHAGLLFHRLRTPRDVARLLRSLEDSGASAAR